MPIQGSGTFAVEAMLTSFVPKTGGKVHIQGIQPWTSPALACSDQSSVRAPACKLLILANGAYGARMAAICKYHGIEHELLETEEVPTQGGSTLDCTRFLLPKLFARPVLALTRPTCEPPAWGRTSPSTRRPSTNTSKSGRRSRSTHPGARTLGY